MVAKSRTTPPEVGKHAAARVDQEMFDNLELLMRTGVDVSNALRDAVALAAQVYDYAWTYGGYPEGTKPRLGDMTFRPYAPPEPEDGADV